MTTDTNTMTIDFTDLDSMAEAVAAGITTPEQLDSFLGLASELVEDCLVLTNSPIYADDGNAEIEYPAGTAANDAAKNYVDDGDWGTIESTTWITVKTYRKGINDDGKIVEVDSESHTITLNPEEPECADGHEHEWKRPHSLLGGLAENPGVWGNGGGVIIEEVCMICGCKKTTNTWAQNPENGEQGLESVEYSAGEFADEINERHVKRAIKAIDAQKSPDGIGQDYVAKINGAWRCFDKDDNDLIEYGIALRADDDAEPGNIGRELDEEEVSLVTEE